MIWGCLVLRVVLVRLLEMLKGPLIVLTHLRSRHDRFRVSAMPTLRVWGWGNFVPLGARGRYLGSKGFRWRDKCLPEGFRWRDKCLPQGFRWRDKCLPLGGRGRSCSGRSSRGASASGPSCTDLLLRPPSAWKHRVWSLGFRVSQSQRGNE